MFAAAAAVLNVLSLQKSPCDWGLNRKKYHFCLMLKVRLMFCTMNLSFYDYYLVSYNVNSI